jgi:endonuclease/exonuclease/phosphatase family metal-dependent hydrolase
MRLMTWNVFWRWGGDYRERAPGIADTLRVYRPDVLGLCETWAGGGRSQPAELAGSLSTEGVAMYSAFARTSLPPEPVPVECPEQAGMQMGIGLVSRWPISAIEVHDLPHEQRGGPAPTALVSTLDHPRGPLYVIVTCLEWEPQYAADQHAQASAVAALANDARFDGPLPVLVLGDLNGAADHAPIAPLMEALVDTFAAGGGDPAAKTIDSAIPHAPVEAKHLIDRRIDHILARAGHGGQAITGTGAFIAGDRPIAGYYPSDHYAVGVDLER